MKRSAEEQNRQRKTVIQPSLPKIPHNALSSSSFVIVVLALVVKSCLPSVKNEKRREMKLVRHFSFSPSL